MAISGVFLVAALAAMTRLGTAFLPEFNEESLTVQATARLSLDDAL